MELKAMRQVQRLIIKSKNKRKLRGKKKLHDLMEKENYWVKEFIIDGESFNFYCL